MRFHFIMIFSGDFYRTRFSACTFMDFIARQAFHELQSYLKTVKFWSLTGDDATDIASRENTLWFIKTCKKGVVQTHYLGCAQLVRANADGKYLIATYLTHLVAT